MAIQCWFPRIFIYYRCNSQLGMVGGDQALNLDEAGCRWVRLLVLDYYWTWFHKVILYGFSRLRFYYIRRMLAVAKLELQKSSTRFTMKVGHIDLRNLTKEGINGNWTKGPLKRGGLGLGLGLVRARFRQAINSNPNPNPPLFNGPLVQFNFHWFLLFEIP